MIKNIKLLLGSSSFEYNINAFFLQNKEKLAQEKMLYMSTSSFLREDFFSAEKNTLVDLFYLWRYPVAQFSWEDNLRPLEEMQALLQRSEAETLVITSHRLLLAPINTPFFTYLQNALQKSSFDRSTTHTQENKQNIRLDICFIDQGFDVEITTEWITQTMRGIYPSLFSLVTNFLIQQNPTLMRPMPMKNILKRVKKLEEFLGQNLQQERSTSLHNAQNSTSQDSNSPSSQEKSLCKSLCFETIEKKYCANETNFVNLALHFLTLNIRDFSLNTSTVSFNLAPEVLRFIQSIVTYYPAYGATNWLSQKDFLQYKINIDKPYTYLNDFYIQKISEKCASWFEENELPNQTDTTNLTAEKFLKESVYDTSLSVSKESALILATRITSDFRKFLLERLNKDTLKYQSQSIRNAFAALLRVEKIITDVEYEELTKRPMGAILTGDESAQNSPLAEPLVTVLTQTYNHEKFIEKQILGVIKQKTSFPVSHIIVDDCSTDKTREILLEYAKKYPHITLILREKNAIGCAVFNVFDQVRTPYVSLCEGDDYFTHANKLQRQVDILEENKDYAITFHATRFIYVDMDDPDGTKNDGTGWKTEFHPSSWPLEKKYIELEELLEGNPIQTNSVMYRWRFSQGTPVWFHRGTTPGDWFWHIMHAETGKIGFDPVVMSAYVRHPKGLFAESVFSVARHRRKFGKREILFFESVNLHLKEQFKKLMRNGQASVFVTLGEDAMDTKDFTYYLDLCKTYPYLSEEFNVSVERIEKIAELEAMRKKIKK